MNLYHLKNEIGDFYVIATDPTSAQNYLEHSLDKADYDFYKKRKVKEIFLLASEIEERDGKHCFSFGGKLLMAKNENSIGNANTEPENKQPTNKHVYWAAIEKILNNYKCPKIMVLYEQ